MTLLLSDVAELISGFDIVDRQHIYFGKMSNKKECCIGVYNLRDSRRKQETIGGDVNSSYAVKPVSLLVHWDRSCDLTEEAAVNLYEAMRDIKNVTVNGNRILFIKMLTDQPIDVGTDDAGIYEMVVEADIYYERRA